jgi:transcriptional regulator with XRE-family HTH domain
LSSPKTPDPSDRIAKQRGVWLQRAREDAELTQAYAAKWLGIHRQTLSRIERGVPDRLSEKLLREMLSLYGRDWEELNDALRRYENVPRETFTPTSGSATRSQITGPIVAPKRARMAPSVYEQVYEYLSRMEKAGVAREAIDEAERLFTRDNYGQLYSGKRELTEDEQLQVVEASWSFIREVILITQGIRLDAPIRRGPSSYDELPTEPKTPPEVTKPSRGQRKA